MPKRNNNLVSAKITAISKGKLEMLKALYRSIPGSEHLAKGDYTTLAALIDREYESMKHLFEKAFDTNS